MTNTTITATPTFATRVIARAPYSQGYALRREEDALAAVFAGRIKPGDVVVIRYEGPRGGPGMREMLVVTAAIVGEGLGESVAMVTDGRFSGAMRSLSAQLRRARSSLV